MIELILLLSVILLGLLIGNKRVDKWLFLKALLLFSVMLSVSISVRVVISFRDSRYHQYESFVIFFIEFNDEKNCFTHRFNENN